MPNLKEFNTRLGVMNGMRRMTSTMQMVAASHVHRMQRNIEAPSAFGTALMATLRDARNIPMFAAHRFFNSAPALPPNPPPGTKAPKALVLVMGSDRGLCGPFNHGIAASTRRWAEEQQEHRALDIETLFIGQKGARLLSRDMPSHEATQTFSAHANITDMLPLADTVLKRFMAGETDEVWISGSRFVNTLRHDTKVRQVLPFPEREQPGATQPAPPLLEPEDIRVLEGLIQQWIQYCLFVEQQHRAINEHAARMIAMSSATDNLDTMKKDLKLRRNRARQAAITNELMEIIAGAEALK